MDGTITTIAIKIGELAKSDESAMVLQDVSNLYFEGIVNEENISLVTKSRYFYCCASMVLI